MKTIVPKQRTVVKWGVGTFGEEVCRPELDRRLYSLSNSILVHPGGLRAGRGPGITSVLAWASLILCCFSTDQQLFHGRVNLAEFLGTGPSRVICSSFPSSGSLPRQCLLPAAGLSLTGISTRSMAHPPSPFPVVLSSDLHTTSDACCTFLSFHDHCGICPFP